MPKIVENEAVYRHAMQLVLERGYAGATTKQIAEASGISEVTLFRKYGNKALLVQKAIAEAMEEADFPTAARYTGDVHADLLRIVQAYQGSAEKGGRFFYVLLSEIPRYPELKELLAIPLAMIDTFGALLARYQAEGVLLPEQRFHSVSALLGPLISANLIRNAAPEIPPPPIDLPTHVSRFLNGRRAS